MLRRNYLALIARSFFWGMAWAFLLLLVEFFFAHPDWEIRRSDIVVIFIGGLAFGAVLFLTVSIGAMLSEGRIRKKYGRLESYEPFQTRTFTVHADYQAAFEKCLGSLQTIGAKGVLSDSAEGLIKAGTGRSWRSSGESIDIRVSAKGTDAAEVAITSRPKISGAVYDNGRGVTNVEELQKAISGGK